MSKLKDKTCSREKRATRAQSRQQMRCLPMFCLSEVYSKTVVAEDRAVCVCLDQQQRCSALTSHSITREMTLITRHAEVRYIIAADD